MALGERNPIAHNAANAALQTDRSQAIAIAGMLDDPACLIGLPVHRGETKAVHVPMDTREAALAALADDNAIVVADNVSVSLATVARIAIVPAHAPFLARLARRDGLHEPWTGSVVGFLTDFRETLNNLLAGRGRSTRDEIVAAAVLDLQRFAVWLVGLALPSPADVLAAWNSSLPSLENVDIAAAINNASAAEWEHCCATLCEWITGRAHAAAQQLADTAWTARHMPLDEIHARTGAAMAQVATAYLRMRYLDVTHLYNALLAVDNYLTAEVRVAYAGLVPDRKALHSRAAQPNMQYTPGPTPTGTVAIVDDGGTWYAGRIIERLRETPVVAEALKASALMTLDGVTLMLFAAMTWRWVYITHVLPKMLRSLRATDRITGSLAMFTRPDVPARTPVHSNTPELLDAMRVYMRAAWNVRTVEALAARSAISLTMPYGSEPALPVSIYVGPAPLNAPAAVVIGNDSDGEPAADKPRKRTRSSDDGSARKFRERQKLLNTLVLTTATARTAGTSMPRSDWGTYAYAHSAAVPQPRYRTAAGQNSKEGVASLLPPIPLVDNDDDEPAPMPEMRRPRSTVRFSKPDVIGAHLHAMALAHTEVLDKQPAGDDSDSDCVRPRQFAALAIYWINNCQSAMPGVHLMKRTRDSMMPQLQRDLGMERSRGRHLRLRKASVLYPLAQQLHKLETRHVNITDSLFDTPGTPVLHMTQA